jgi:hypothetical protein
VVVIQLISFLGHLAFSLEIMEQLNESYRTNC